MNVLRRKLGLVVAAVLLTPLFVLMMVADPDLSGEMLLVQRLVDLEERLRHAEMLNRERLHDVIVFSEKLHALARADTNASLLLGRPLPPALRGVLRNMSRSDDLLLPSAYSYLPHLLRSPRATEPLFKLSRGRTGVSMVLGVPTVKRQVQSYLMTTLHNLIESMTDNDRENCLIVVFVAEWDIDYVHQVASLVEKKLGTYVESGLLEVISPPAEFYPDLEYLRQTLGDPMERVRWRTKQNLDFAFLMMYSQPKGVFYVQLEDDIQTKKGYITTMKKFALQKSAEKKNWFVLDFCQLGFIGKMFKCIELPYLVQFFLMFYNDKPVDWLLDYLIQTKICNLDKDAKHCRKAKENVWIHYKPSLFQHIGTHSSLKGKVQKLKDKQFGKVKLYFPHANPVAKIESAIKPYKMYTLQRAYLGESFFWGLLPQQGDLLQFTFSPPVVIKKFLFRSGNVEHPSDRLYNTTVEVLPAKTDIQSISAYKKTADNYYIVGEFDDLGVAEGEVSPSFAEIQTMRLHVYADSDNWAIISEIHILPEEKR